MMHVGHPFKTLAAICLAALASCQSHAQAPDPRVTACIMRGGTPQACAAALAAPGAAPTAPAAAAPGDCAAAEADWKRTQQQDTLAAYQRHLVVFPTCPTARTARARIAALSGSAQPTPDESNRIVLVAGPTGPPVRTPADLVDLIKMHHGAIDVGCAPDTSCVAVERFKHAAELDFGPIPYRKIASVIADLTGGRIKFAFLPMTSVLQSIKDGKLRAIAVTGPTRSPNLAQVPTMSELGIRAYKASEPRRTTYRARSPEWSRPSPRSELGDYVADACGAYA